MNYQLGDAVKISGYTKKVRDWTAMKEGTSYPRINHPPQFNDAWGKHHNLPHGIIVGKRTILDGSTEVDEGYYFCPKPGTARTVWLVAFDLRRRPVMVYPDQIEYLTTRVDSSRTDA